jgi:hypothetical protein
MSSVLRIEVEYETNVKRPSLFSFLSFPLFQHLFIFSCNSNVTILPLQRHRRFLPSPAE